MPANPLVNSNQLYTQGQTSYVDPMTGKTVYLDKVGSGGMDLTSMNLSNPTAISPTSTSGSFDSNALLSSLFKSPLSGGGGYNLPSLSAPATFANTYKAPSTSGTDQAFQSYIDSITGASPAEAATRQTEQDILKQTLEDIDLQTNQGLASTKLDMLDRGLGGPGQFGDIEANALAQVRTGGVKAADAARLSLAQTDEARAADREKALSAAYGTEYQTKAAQDSQAAQIAATGATTDVNSINDLLKTQFQGAITTGEGAATRASNTRDSLISNLLNYGLGQQKLSAQDQEFYAGLISTEEQNAAQRQADYNKQLLSGSQGGGTDFWTGLGESLLTGVAGGVAGGIGDTLTGGIKNALTPKKKVVTAGVA